MKITFGSNLLVQSFFPGNNSPMSDCVERLDRTTATIIPDSENFIEYVFLSAGPDAKQSGIRIILVNHGMGRSLDEKSVEQWRKWAAEKKIGVVLHNYPGYGKTPGPVTVERIIEDQRVLIKNLLDKHEPTEIAVLGNSIGCGPTMAMADEFDLGMVILVSPYMSCCSFRGSFSWRSLVFQCFRDSLFDPFNCHKLVHRERLKQQRILIICGEIDKTIDPVNSMEIQKFIGDNVMVCILPGVDHKSARWSGDRLIGLFLHRQDDELEKAMAKATSAEEMSTAHGS